MQNILNLSILNQSFSLSLVQPEQLSSWESPGKLNGDQERTLGEAGQVFRLTSWQTHRSKVLQEMKVSIYTIN